MATLKIRIDPSAARSGGREVVRTLKDIRASARGGAREVRGLEGNLEKFKGTALSLRHAVGAGAIGLFGREAVQEFAAFETGLVGVGKTADLGGAALQALGDQIEGMSKRIPVATAELLGIAQAAGQLGVKGADNILLFTDTVAKMGRATDLVGEEAATTLARLLNVTGESISTVGTLGSVLVALGNSSAATEREIALVAQRVAQATVQFNVSSAQAAALAAAMKSVGINAELAGSTTGRAFQTIDAAVRSGGDALRDLQELTGEIGFADIFREDSVRGFQLFLEGLGRIKAEGGDVIGTLKDFGLEGIRINQVLPTLAKNAQLVAEKMAIANAEVANATALNLEAAKAFDTLDGRLQVTENNLRAVLRAFGEEYEPVVSEAARLTTEFAADTDQVVASTQQAAAVIAGVLVLRGIRPYTQALVENIQTSAASRQALELQRQSTLAAAAARAKQTKTELAALQTARATAASELRLAKINLQAAVSSQQRRIAGEQTLVARARLAAATNAQAAASVGATAAALRESVATQALTRSVTLATTATAALTVAKRGLATASSLLGGPLGIALVVGALVQYKLQAREAATETDSLLERLRLLAAAGRDTSAADIKAAQFKIRVLESQSRTKAAEIAELEKRRAETRAALQNARASASTEFGGSAFAALIGEPNVELFGDLDGQIKKLQDERDAIGAAIRERKSLVQEIQTAQAARAAALVPPKLDAGGGGDDKKRTSELEAFLKALKRENELLALNEQARERAIILDRARAEALRDDASGVRTIGKELTQAETDDINALVDAKQRLTAAEEQRERARAASASLDETLADLQAENALLTQQAQGIKVVADVRREAALAAEAGTAAAAATLARIKEETLLNKSLTEQIKQQDDTARAREQLSTMLDDLRAQNVLLERQAQGMGDVVDMRRVDALLIKAGIPLNDIVRDQLRRELVERQRLQEEIRQTAERQRLATERAQDFASVITKGFEDAVLSGEDLRVTLQALLEDIERILIRIAITKPLETALTTAIGGFFAPGRGGIGGGTQFDPVVISPTFPQATREFARGAVFDSGQVQAFARGGLLTEPTVFPLANGAGIAGEAGPEGVFPLMRTASGDLGVQGTVAAPVVPVNITFVDNVGVDAKVEERPNARGGRDITITLDEAVAGAVQRGGPTTRALERTFGVQRQGARLS